MRDDNQSKRKRKGKNCEAERGKRGRVNTGLSGAQFERYLCKDIGSSL